MVNHSIMCRSITYDYMNIITWTILKKTQILNGCETFAVKYILKIVAVLRLNPEGRQFEDFSERRIFHLSQPFVIYQ